MASRSDALVEAFPIFRDAERVIADPVVRKRGTLGGSLCQADPSEDLSAVCTTLDASCVIQGRGGTRVVSMEEFHQGPYETAVGVAELLREIRIPLRPGGSSAYEKVERRAGDWAVVSSGAAVWLDDGGIADARVGLAAVGPNTAGRSMGCASSEQLERVGNDVGHRVERLDRPLGRPGYVEDEALADCAGAAAMDIGGIVERLVLERRVHRLCSSRIRRGPLQDRVHLRLGNRRPIRPRDGFRSRPPRRAFRRRDGSLALAVTSVVLADDIRTAR